MKKILSVILSSLFVVSMMFGFVSCSDEPYEVIPNGVAINTKEELRDFATGSGSFVDVAEAYIAQDIVIDETITFNKDNITLNSLSDAELIIKDATSTYGNKIKKKIVLDVFSSDVTFNDLNIIVDDEKEEYIVIFVEGINGTVEPDITEAAIGFVMNNCNIVGKYADGIEDFERPDIPGTDDSDYTNISIGVLLGKNTNATIIGGSITSCSSAVYISDGKFTIKDLSFDGYVYCDYLEIEPEHIVVENLSSAGGIWEGKFGYWRNQTEEDTEVTAFLKEIANKNKVKVDYYYNKTNNEIK